MFSFQLKCKKYLFLAVLVIVSISSFLLLPLPENELISIGPCESNGTYYEETSLNITYQGYAYHHATSGYNGEISDLIHVGRDFDFLNERWRGFIEFDLNQIPNDAQITGVQMRLHVNGKPEVCDNQRVQLGFYPITLQPSQNSFNFSGLFDNFIEGTPYNNETLYPIANDGYFPTSGGWISFGDNMSSDIENSLSADWFAISFIDYYESSLGHDTDQDEGIVCEVTNFQINYTSNSQNFTANYSSPPTSDNDNSDPNESDIFIVITIIGVLVVVIFIVGVKTVINRNPTEQLESKNKFDDNASRKTQLKNEQNQLRKFKEILEITQRVKIHDVAQSLGIEYSDLFEKLLRWKKDIPFKIDGEMIVVEDISNFVGVLDSEFQSWENNKDLDNNKIV